MRPSRTAVPRKAVSMEIEGDVITRSDESGPSRRAGPPSSSMLRGEGKDRMTSRHFLDDLLVVLIHAGWVVFLGRSERPSWFKEMLFVKASRVLEGEHELRRVDWEAEDDEVVDRMIVEGKLNDARAYFDEKKATSVPVYRETLRYFWTQTGGWGSLSASRLGQAGRRVRSRLSRRGL